MNLRSIAAAAAITAAAGLVALAAAGPASAYPSGQDPNVQISTTAPVAGEDVSFTLTNMTPDQDVTLTIHSDPVQIGSGHVPAGATSLTLTGTIPASFSGSHTIVVETQKDGAFSFSVTVRTTAPTGTPTDPGTGTGTPTAPGGTGTTVTDGGSPTSTDAAPGTGSGSNGDGGPLANTGAAVTGLGILGAVLVAGGVFFVAAGRRRGARGGSAA